VECVGCFWDKVNYSDLTSIVERLKSTDWEILEISLDDNNNEYTDTWRNLKTLDKLRNESNVRFEIFYAKGIRSDRLFLARNKLIMQYWKMHYEQFPQSIYDPFPRSKPSIIYLKRRWIGHTSDCSYNYCESLGLPLSKEDIIDRAEIILKKIKELYSIRKLSIAH
jgi:hypothetical protein